MPAENNTRSRVVIDTNVFISGFTFKGKPREVLDLAWSGEFELYISPFILKEIEHTLREDFGWSKEDVKDTIQKTKAKTTLVHPQTKVSVIKEKDDDNRILECALEARVSYLVSGDKKHLLALREYQGIRILSPAEFLRLL